MIAIGIVVLICTELPLIARAQSSDADLRATIRAEIMKDPRSASMTEAEITAMVNALTKGAEEQGVESRQFSATESSAAAQPESAPACGGMPAFLCTINQSFGFDGSNPVLPIALFATSGLLAFLLYELKHHIRLHGHMPLA